MAKKKDKDPHAVFLGRLGGKAQTQKLSAEQRREIARPSKLSMRRAAALPLVAITAWEGLVDRAKVCADQTVLVHAGAGRVSTLQSNQRVPMAQESCTTVFGREEDLSSIRAWWTDSV